MNKRWKAILALVLALSLVLALAACGSSEQKQQDSTASDSGAQDAGTPDSGAAQPEGEADKEPVDEDPTEIVWQFYDLRMTASDYGEHVYEKVNEILKEKLNVHATIVPVIAADYNNQFNMTVAGGEQLDLVGLTGRLKLADMYSQNQAMDITDLMPEYAPDALALTQDYVGALSYEGRIYGVPTLRNFCTNGYIIMRKDILEELNLLEKAQKLATWSEYEEILAAVTERYAGSGLYGVTKGPQWTIITSEGNKLYNGDKFADTIVYDRIRRSGRFAGHGLYG